MNFVTHLYIIWVRAKLNVLALVSKAKAAESAFRVFCTPKRKSRKRPSAILARAEELEFKLNEKRVRGYSWNRGKKKKLLIVHGFESAARNFDGYVEPLMQKGYAVMAFDAPAHGRSQGRRLNLPLYLQMLRTVERQYGPFDAYIAHSFGALALSLLLEDSFGQGEKRAVLIAPLTETISAINNFFQFLGLSHAFRAEFDHYIRQMDEKGPEWYSLSRSIHQIHGPVLWIHDTGDRIAEFADAARVRPTAANNVSWMFTEGLGHRRIYRDPGVMEKVLAFL